MTECPKCWMPMDDFSSMCVDCLPDDEEIISIDMNKGKEYQLIKSESIIKEMIDELEEISNKGLVNVNQSIITLKELQRRILENNKKWYPIIDNLYEFSKNWKDWNKWRFFWYAFIVDWKSQYWKYIKHCK